MIDNIGNNTGQTTTEGLVIIRLNS